ncbi:mediator of DNA damage checkpoint protein 1 isoform 1-T1 [Clarias gariepinus]
MDATQQIEDSFFGEEDDSDEEHEDGEGKGQRRPLAVLKVFKNNHIPETEVPLYQGENVLGRDPTSCSVPLQARSVSGRHAVISVSVFGPNERHAHSEATEALLWDLGSLNGTRKGRLKLTPHVRYALTEGDGLVLADLPCQYVSLKNADTSTADNGREKAKGLKSASSSSGGGVGTGAKNAGKKCALPPVPLWTEEAKSAESVQMSPKKPERTLVPESDSDSDGERHGRRDRKRIVVSDSASSDLSSPTCSTFLSPANKVIPESEDESSITPSSALKGRFLKTGNDTKVSSDSPKPDPLLFNIDSDTDVEDEEEEMMKDAPKTITAEVGAVSPADLHMDSDTDVEDEDIEKAKSDPEAVPVKQDAVNPAVLNMDSDTDVEDNEPVKMHTTTVLSGGEVSLEEKKETKSSSGQLHLESDTDVEDEDDVPRMQDAKPPTSHLAEFNLNSDTDVDEDETTKGDETESKDLEPKSVDNINVPDAKMSHDQSDNDTDVEDDDDTEIGTPAAAKVTGKSLTRSENQTANTSSTNAEHDSPVQGEAPFRLDSDTDVEEDEDKVEEDEDKVEEKEQRGAESTVQVVHSSTPKGAGVSGEELETQAFLSPSQLFKRPGLPSLLHPSVSPGGIIHPDDDFAVAETQSFVCDAAQVDATLDETPQSLDGPESRHSHEASSFQLSLSDSSHQLPEAAEHDGEPAEEEWQLQATQLYEGSTKAGEIQDLDSTQAYVCATDQEEEEDDGEKDEEEQATKPLDTQSYSNIHTAETQLIKPRALNEDNSDRDTNEEVVASEPEIKAKEDVSDEMQVDSHLSTADTLLIVRSPRQEEHTQPYAFLAAQIQKGQEETEKEEHESRDLGDREDQTNEGETAQEEERTGIEKENELTREEDKKERGENERVENDNEVDDAQTQLTEAGPIVETLPMCEEEEGQEEKQMNECRSSRGTQPAHVESRQSLEPDDHTRLAIAETLPMCEKEDEQDEEQLNEPCSSRGTQPAHVESTQPLESDDHTHVATAETLPLCEEEEELEEEKNKPRKSKGAGRKRQTAKIETIQLVESDEVTRVSVAETQPMCKEDEEGQEEEQRNETTSTRRSSTRRQGAKTKPHIAISETLPLCEEEEAQEEATPSEVVSGRKSRRGRQTPKVETAQANEHDSTTDTVKMEEEEEVQDSRRNLRGKERGRAASGKVKGKGKVAAGKEKRGKRGQMEQEEDSEEEVERGNKGRGRKSLRLKSKDDDEARLELMEAGNEKMDHVKKQEEEEESKRLQIEKKKEARDQLERERKEREESARLKKEREEREEREKMERLEREKKEREEKEIKEREEMERLEKEKQLEKERREQEEKDRLERERIEKENREKEEQEKLERMMRERQELEKERKKQEEKDRLEKERIEKENREKEEKQRLERAMAERQELEKERKKQEEKDQLEKEKRDRNEEEKKLREEKEKQEIEQNEKEKKSKDVREDMDKEKERRPAPGKRKAGLQRRGKKSKKEEDQELEEETKEGLETKQELSKMQKEECEEGKSKKQEQDEHADGDSKTRRGRRTTRKSVAPPAGAEDEGGPAKRTRSRSNSSNSVCSEQSAQESLNGGRGERRRTAEEENDKVRASGRRRRTTTTAPSSEKEEIKQASNSRSNSRSSERSSSSAATPSRGRGRKKSVKVELPEEEEREQSAAVGRGRGRGKGRGGKLPGGNYIKEDAAEKTEVMAVAKDGVTCQSSSRGRKRGVDVSMLMEETPQPTPKTPRRSLTGQTHKVLFTGVVDEDGEKVVVRLGGGLAKGVADMTHLVTDKVRRTVKFLCAVARGVPIVTPDWLSKCGKAGSFLSPNGFLVKDTEQEKKFNFSLQESLRVASSQPLLQGYEIHVTPSVKPEPAHMKEIITCCGARFLPKMPSARKAQTVVVVSCEEDGALCERARSLSFPVVSAEFLLTGILQQKVDLQTHALSLSPAAAATKPVPRSRGK